MAENSVDRVMNGIWSLVSTLMQNGKIQRPDDTAAERHLKQFLIGIPIFNPTCLGDIVNAGWLYHAQVMTTAKSSAEVTEKLYHLNEMLLKSIEVLEYRRRVS